MCDALRLETPADGVLLATLDRPPVNALDAPARQGLAALIEQVEGDPGVRCVVLTGRGPAFCGGADLHEEEALQASTAGAFFGDFGRILTGLQTLRAPVIAAVNGPCAGGGLELALSCDLRIGSRSASFTAAGVNVGLVASFYGLSTLLGSGRAASMLLTGLRCDAARALQFGLLTDVHPPERLREEAIRLARRIASRAPLAVEATKRCLRRVPDLDAHEAFLLQGRELVALSRTADHKEAIRAFFERREGRYSRS